MGGARPRTGRLAALAGVLLLAACTGGGTSGGAPTSATAAPAVTPERPPGGFYAVPDPLPPGPPGALIRATPVAGVPVLPDSRAWAVLYHSRDVDGRDVAVSGVVVVPPGAAPPDGRPVVVWGHGSVGLADRCAPSHAGVLGALGPWLGGLLQQGVVVAATDYQGLGTPGPARSLIGLSAGRAVLDVARAARGLEAAGAGVRVVLAGHSEGGHAVLWAAELARSYAPELQVLGVAATAPGAELATTLKLSRFRPAAVTSGAMLIVVAWGDAYRVPPDVLTPAGRRAADRVRTRCLEELARDPATPAVRLGELLTTPPWPALLARNTPGHAATPAPILLAQGADDDRVTPAATRALVQRLCHAGDTVELRSFQHVGHFDLPKGRRHRRGGVDRRPPGRPARPLHLPALSRGLRARSSPAGRRRSAAAP
jgi:alpha-beta hydrolase superfamily lysophospholipase